MALIRRLRHECLIFRFIYMAESIFQQQLGFLRSFFREKKYKKRHSPFSGARRANFKSICDERSTFIRLHVCFLVRRGYGRPCYLFTAATVRRDAVRKKARQIEMKRVVESALSFPRDSFFFFNFQRFFFGCRTVTDLGKFFEILFDFFMSL